MEREQKLITSAFYNLGVDLSKGVIKTQPLMDEDDEEEELVVPAKVPEKEKQTEKENSKVSASTTARRVVMVHPVV